MTQNNLNNFTNVVVPIFELDKSGAVIPNTLFHRTWDHLHSRCIEYPFAASQVGDAKYLLDVGTTKSDSVWISWLESLPIEVHATDYDPPLVTLKNIVFHQADVRKLPIADSTFDKIIAVSVIEHIGLHSPQVIAESLPPIDQNGDLEAVRELARVLKPDGELIMTLPFGIKDELILGQQARNYTTNSIRKFEVFLKPIKLEYYEYQRRKFIGEKDRPVGLITWNRIPITSSKALHHNHTEGVVCGVWKKNAQEDMISNLASKLRLKQINLVIFPNWSQPEELIFLEIKSVINTIATHPDRSCITLLIDTTNISEEDANLVISGVAMNLLMEENLDVDEGPEISIVGQLSEIQRSDLLTRTQARIILENENQRAIAATGINNIPTCNLSSLSNMRAVQLTTGNWQFQ